MPQFKRKNVAIKSKSRGKYWFEDLEGGSRNSGYIAMLLADNKGKQRAIPAPQFNLDHPRLQYRSQSLINKYAAPGMAHNYAAVRNPAVVRRVGRIRQPRRVRVPVNRPILVPVDQRPIWDSDNDDQGVDNVFVPVATRGKRRPRRVHVPVNRPILVPVDQAPIWDSDNDDQGIDNDFVYEAAPVAKKRKAPQYEDFGMPRAAKKAILKPKVDKVREAAFLKTEAAVKKINADIAVRQGQIANLTQVEDGKVAIRRKLAEILAKVSEAQDKIDMLHMRANSSKHSTAEKTAFRKSANKFEKSAAADRKAAIAEVKANPSYEPIFADAAENNKGTITNAVVNKRLQDELTSEIKTQRRLIRAEDVAIAKLLRERATLNPNA